jgi:hypothetical protein
MSLVPCVSLESLLTFGPDRIDEVEVHCASCPDCQPLVAGNHALSEVAGTLRSSWPSPGLWTRIESSLDPRAGEVLDHAAIPFASVPPYPRWLRPGLWQIAAAMFLLALSAVVAVVTQRRGVGEDEWMVRAAAIDSVENAERAHLEAIDRLAEVAAPELQAAATPLLVSYKEKLMLIDDAIAECRTGIATNQYNAHLRRELLAMYVAKQRTLEEIVNGENHAQQTRR